MSARLVDAVAWIALGGVATAIWLTAFVASVWRVSTGKGLGDLLPKGLAGPPRKPGASWDGVRAALARIRGQELAARLVVEELRARFALGERKGAAASFLFVGPVGGGKSDFASALAVGLGRQLVHVDMGTLARQPDEVIAKPLLAHPRAVVLFDYADKADPRFYAHLVWILDGERVGLVEGKRVDARAAVVIFAITAGHEKVAEVLRQVGEGPRLDEALGKALREASALPHEILSRIDRVVPFVALSKEARLAVIEDLVRAAAAAVNVELAPVPGEVLAHLFAIAGGDGAGAGPDVRSLRKSVERALAVELARHRGARVRLALEHDEVRALPIV